MLGKSQKSAFLHLAPTEWEVAWAPEPVRTFRSVERLFSTTGIRNQRLIEMISVTEAGTRSSWRKVLLFLTWTEDKFQTHEHQVRQIVLVPEDCVYIMIFPCYAGSRAVMGGNRIGKEQQMYWNIKRAASIGRQQANKKNKSLKQESIFLRTPVMLYAVWTMQVAMLCSLCCNIQQLYFSPTQCQYLRISEDVINKHGHFHTQHWPVYFPSGRYSVFTVRLELKCSM